jgi:hypothetical protein
MEWSSWKIRKKLGGKDITLYKISSNIESIVQFKHSILRHGEFLDNDQYKTWKNN